MLLAPWTNSGTCSCRSRKNQSSTASFCDIHILLWCTILYTCTLFRLFFVAEINIRIDFELILQNLILRLSRVFGVTVCVWQRGQCTIRSKVWIPVAIVFGRLSHQLRIRSVENTRVLSICQMWLGQKTLWFWSSRSRKFHRLVIGDGLGVFFGRIVLFGVLLLDRSFSNNLVVLNKKFNSLVLKA